MGFPRSDRKSAHRPRIAQGNLSPIISAQHIRLWLQSLFLLLFSRVEFEAVVRKAESAPRARFHVQAWPCCSAQLGQVHSLRMADGAFAFILCPAKGGRTSSGGYHDVLEAKSSLLFSIRGIRHLLNLERSGLLNLSH